MMKRVARLVLVVMFLSQQAHAQTPASASDEVVPLRPIITQLTADLYRFQAGEEVSVFLVTSDGIVLVDPLSRGVAAGLDAEFTARFPGRAVRYVVYTRHQ